MSRRTAGCHCGQVRLEFDTDEPLVALECNCSICRMLGYLHVIRKKDEVRFLAGEERLASYRFNTGVADHLFCPTCGVKPVYVPRSHPDGLSINARCIDGLDLAELEIRPFDGANWEQNVASIQGND